MEMLNQIHHFLSLLLYYHIVCFIWEGFSSFKPTEELNTYKELHMHPYSKYTHVYTKVSYQENHSTTVDDIIIDHDVIMVFKLLFIQLHQ